MFEIFGQLILGWLFADFITGVFHWWEDEIGQESWPVIGPWLIAPNRYHHIKPLAFSEGGFWGRNLASIIAAIIIGLVWFSLFGASVFMITTLVVGALANEIHYFAHRPSKANKMVTLLQNIGLFQSSKEHAKHHKPPQKTNYCVVTNYLNPILETLNFWRRLEALLGKKSNAV